MSVYLSISFGDDVTHDQSCDVRHLRHMKTSSMMSRMLRDDVIMSYGVCHLHHDDDDVTYIR